MTSTDKIFDTKKFERLSPKSGRVERSHVSANVKLAITRFSYDVTNRRIGRGGKRSGKWDAVFHGWRTVFSGEKNGYNGKSMGYPF